MNTNRPSKMQIADGRRGSWFGVRENAEVRTQNAELKSFIFNVPRSSFHVHRSAFRLPPSAFTLIEMLVTLTIIAILTGIMLGTIRYARTAAAEAQTKNTIAKLNDIVLKQYESYMTRRVPIDTTGIQPREAAKLRYCALLDLMRMEMPERTYDILSEPIGGWTVRPSTSQMFLQKYNKANPGYNYRSAKYLYMWISMTHPDALEQFSQNEIADIDSDGWPVFVDGWGMPIMFLRWAPGFLPPNSDIQTGDQINDHDPFDTRRIFNVSGEYYRLVPLIYSPGPDKKYGIKATAQTGGVEEKAYYGVDPAVNNVLTDLNPYKTLTTQNILIGQTENLDHIDNIHNHRIEQK